MGVTLGGCPVHYIHVGRVPHHMKTRFRIPRLIPGERRVLQKRPNDTGDQDEDAIRERIERQTEELAYASQWKLVWRKFKKHKLALVAAIIIALAYLLAIFADFFTPYDPNRRFSDYALGKPTGIHSVDEEGRFSLRPFVYGYERQIDPDSFRRFYVDDTSRKYNVRFLVQGDEYRLFGFIPARLRLFGAEEGGRVFLFGTDQQGRCLFSQLVHGGRVSLSIGLIGVTLSFIIGIVLGGISGYFGGVVDTLIQRLIEILRSFPTLPLWMALGAALPVHWPVLRLYFFITLILSLIGWTTMARVVRGKFLSLREEDYVAAATIAGASPRRIMFRHMLPSFISHLIAAASLSIPGMILGETALSFLGLGLRRPAISWGVLLQQAQNINAVASAPWLMIAVFPVIIVVLAFNFFGDGLRDAADPYS
jgi:peptide/nickel transport system permease protein